MMKLPYTPGSESELLASTAIFAADLRSFTASEWRMETDQFVHRNLRFQVELLQLFKGEVADPRGALVPVEVEQIREDPYMAQDVPGLWPYVEPETGPRLIFAHGPSNTIAEAMRDPNIRLLLPDIFTADVRAAFGALNLLASHTEVNPGSDYDAVIDLIDLVHGSAVYTHDIFARFFWEQIAEVYARYEIQLYLPILDLIDAPTSNPPFRAALLASLYRATILMGATPARCRRLLPELFAFLLRQDLHELYYELVEVQIYNLLFRPDRPAPPALELIPDHTRRLELASIVSGFKTLRAQEISSWLLRT